LVIWNRENMRFRPPSRHIRSALAAVTAGMIFILLAVWGGMWILDAPTAGRILTMVGANHLGGRLAFIAVGLEQGFSSLNTIIIIVAYNTTYVLLMYTLFVFFYGKMKKARIFRNFVQGMQAKAEKRKKLLNKWNWMGIMFFVWVPLPWTGATIGTYIAHMEGYRSRQTLAMVLPAMWVGVISWTLWFDELYDLIDRLGRGKTMFVTVAVVALPLLFYVFDIFRQRKKPPADL